MVGREGQEGVPGMDGAPGKDGSKGMPVRQVEKIKTNFISPSVKPLKRKKKRKDLIHTP